MGRWAAEASEVSTVRRVNKRMKVLPVFRERLEGDFTFAETGKGESRDIPVRRGREAAEICDDTIIDTSRGETGFT